MEINGRYNVYTRDRHTPDECKSAMQKYARRGDCSSMFYAVQQLNSLCEYSGTDRSKHLPMIKAMRTNMINRISVILFEDVSYRSFATFERVCALIMQWKHERMEDGDDGRKILMDICRNIAAAKKARQPSFLRNYYGYRKDVALYADFNDMMTTEKPLDASFSWIYQNEDEAHSWLAMHAKSSIPFTFALNELKRLKKSPRTSDRLFFLTVPMLWLKYGCDANDEEQVQLPEINELVLTEFDDFVYDMHTKRGRHKNKKEFLSEGAFVTNEDDKAVDYEMKRLYERQYTPVRIVRINYTPRA